DPEDNLPLVGHHPRNPEPIGPARRMCSLGLEELGQLLVRWEKGLAHATAFGGTPRTVISHSAVALISFTIWVPSPTTVPCSTCLTRRISRTTGIAFSPGLEGSPQRSQMNIALAPSWSRPLPPVLQRGRDR